MSHSSAAYLRTSEAAVYLSLSRKQLELWRSRGEGPPFVKLARAVRYRRDDLDHFMRERLVEGKEARP